MWDLSLFSTPNSSYVPPQSWPVLLGLNLWLETRKPSSYVAAPTVFLEVAGWMSESRPCSWPLFVLQSTVNVLRCIKNPFIIWPTLLTMSSFIRLPIVSQAQQGLYICMCVCVHVTVFCRRHFILQSPSPASQFCLLDDIMIMEVMLHHICQVQQMFFCSANHLPKANCLYVKQFLSAHPSSISWESKEVGGG